MHCLDKIKSCLHWLLPKGCSWQKIEQFLVSAPPTIMPGRFHFKLLLKSRIVMHCWILRSGCLGLSGWGSPTVWSYSHSQQVASLGFKSEKPSWGVFHLEYDLIPCELDLIQQWAARIIQQRTFVSSTLADFRTYFEDFKDDFMKVKRTFKNLDDFFSGEEEPRHIGSFWLLPLPLSETEHDNTIHPTWQVQNYSDVDDVSGKV